jgi:hypothetical protein
MKWTQALNCVLLLTILTVSTLVQSIPQASSVEPESAPSLKDGDRVYMDSANAYISAAPHALTADGYLHINLTSKASAA